MTSLHVENFGPILDANVEFGDLTILVGPQASGKSLFLELFKFEKDRQHIISTLSDYNYILPKDNIKPLLDYYFGEGLSSLFHTDTEVFSDGKRVNLCDIHLDDNQKKHIEKVFMIPAQRILSIDDGRPRNFMEFDITTPYPLRYFSETLRIFVQGGMGNPDVIFPMKSLLNNRMRQSISCAIFHNGKIVMDKSTSQRKMKLNVNSMSLPFMTWSAGQKEFLPLLLAFYRLSEHDTKVLHHEDYEWVIIEEPEMGLHPRAIETIMLQIIELLNAGYKIIISTHSATLMDFIWILQQLPHGDKNIMKKAMCDLFNIDISDPSSSIFNSISEKIVKTYYFSHSGSNGVITHDISSLNSFDEDSDIAEWGGISNFADRASDIVSRWS